MHSLKRVVVKYFSAVLSLGFVGCQAVPTRQSTVPERKVQQPLVDPRAYVDDIVLREGKIYPDPSGLKSVSGDLRPFWIAEGRVQNTAPLRNADSIRIRFYITVPGQSGPDYVDTADVIVKDVPQSATKSFRESIRLDPPKGKWSLDTEVVEVKTSPVVHP